MIRFSFMLAATLVLVSCASTSPAEPVVAVTSIEAESGVAQSSGTIGSVFNPHVVAASIPEIAEFSDAVVLPPSDEDPARTIPFWFERLDGWNQAAIAPGLEAFQRSCEQMSGRSEDALLSSRAPWAGRVGYWLPVCTALAEARDAQTAQHTFETLMRPVELSSRDVDPHFTGYFEPVYHARRSPQGIFTEPVPLKPNDIYMDGTQANQTLRNGMSRPYPSREEITRMGVEAMAYAHPADVFFMQIQGSGRLVFENGDSVRAAYAAHNGHEFGSTANWLLERGEITRGEASMQGIRAWMDRVSPTRAREAMNANPRFVFFEEQSIPDPARGPNGAAGLPLTALGSVAVDPQYIPYGMPLLVSTNTPGLSGEWMGLLIAQDTGGAIRGPLRGDIYFGTGFEAGQRAGTTNTSGKIWAVLPASVVSALEVGS